VEFYAVGHFYAIMKRFSETTKWRDSWFRRLTTAQKCLWIYLCDICDHAGVFEFDAELFTFETGAKITQKDIDALDGRVVRLSGEKWIIPKFINFQYGKLSPDCKPHKSVFSALEKHGINPNDIEQNQRFKPGIPSSLRDSVIQRDGGICVYTGKRLLPDQLHIDHVVPRSKGGATRITNLVCMDAALNILKNERSLDEFCFSVGLPLDEVKERVGVALSKGIHTLQEKEKDKEEDKEQEQYKSREKGTLDDIMEFCRESGLFPRDAESCFHKWEGNGWTNGKQKIKDWKATIRAWKAQGFLPSQKNPSPSDHWPEPQVQADTEPEIDLMAKLQANIAKRKAAEEESSAPPESMEGEPEWT
jgi:hypothetical protein